MRRKETWNLEIANARKIESEKKGLGKHRFFGPPEETKGKKRKRRE